MDTHEHQTACNGLDVCSGTYSTPIAYTRGIEACNELLSTFCVHDGQWPDVSRVGQVVTLNQRNNYMEHLNRIRL